MKIRLIFAFMLFSCALFGQDVYRINSVKFISDGVESDWSYPDGLVRIEENHVKMIVSGDSYDFYTYGEPEKDRKRSTHFSSNGEWYTSYVWTAIDGEGGDMFFSMKFWDDGTQQVMFFWDENNYVLVQLKG